MASVVSFYNIYDSIKIVTTGTGPESGSVVYLNKESIQFTLSNDQTFCVKSGTIALVVRYSEVSTSAPNGHTTIDQLIHILESWVASEIDDSVNPEKDAYARLRVVEPTIIFDSVFRNGLEMRKFNSFLKLGTETLTYDSESAAAVLTLPVTTLAKGVL